MCAGYSCAQWSEPADRLPKRIQNEDAIVLINGHVKTSADSTINAGASSQFLVFDQSVRSGDCALELAGGRVNVNAGEALLASNEIALTRQSEEDRIATAAESVDLHASLAPGGFETSIQGIGLDTRAAGIGNSQLSIGCNPQVEVWARNSKSRIVATVSSSAETIDHFAGALIKHDDFAVSSIGRVDHSAVDRNSGEVGFAG